MSPATSRWLVTGARATSAAASRVLRSTRSGTACTGHTGVRVLSLGRAPGRVRIKRARPGTATGMNLDRRSVPAVLMTAAGSVLGGLSAAAALLRHGKPLHPAGTVYDALLRRTGTARRWGSAWLDEMGEDRGLVRLSRAVGLPAAVPDILGLRFLARRRATAPPVQSPRTEEPTRPDLPASGAALPAPSADPATGSLPPSSAHDPDRIRQPEDQS